MTFYRSLNFWIECAASFFTVAGIALGTTTGLGASLYTVCLVFWWWLTFRRELWGLLPLQAAATVVTAVNLWAAA